MTALAGIEVPCPECGEKVFVDIRSTSEYVEGDGLRVTLTPDVSKMAEHYVAEHAGADVSEP